MGFIGFIGFRVCRVLFRGFRGVWGLQGVLSLGVRVERAYMFCWSWEVARGTVNLNLKVQGSFNASLAFGPGGENINPAP